MTPMTPMNSVARRVDLFVVLGLTVLLQLLFPMRRDWPGHFVAGAGFVWMVAVLLPRRFGSSAVEVSWVALAASAWALETWVFEPFDLVDVVFTFAGAMVVTGSLAELADAPVPERRLNAVWGLAFVVVGYVYRTLGGWGAP